MHAQSSTPPVPIPCESCGTLHENVLHNGKRGRFCSRVCAARYAQSRMKPASLAERLFRQVEKTDSCWLWTGKTYEGYGYVTYQYQRIGAHRVSWELHRGPIPEGLCVLHNCPGGDNRACVNPDHLFLGTRGDNCVDTAKKGRTCRGERHPFHIHPELGARGTRNGQARLNEDQVREIRRLYHEDRIFTAQIALQFGLTKKTVQAIIQRRRWAHVE